MIASIVTEIRLAVAVVSVSSRALADRSGSDDLHRWLDELAEKTATGENPEEFRQLLT